MKIKYLLLTVCSIAMLGSSMTAYAQPKTMPDGTVFDAEFYAETYPDVKAAFGNDEKALYNHYVTLGKAEGRKATATATTTAETNDSFDPVFYANTYPDVKAAFGNDEKALYNHYMKCGKAEGRLGSAPKANTVSATPTTAQASVVSVETISDYFSTRGTVVYGTITTLSDGTKIAKTDINHIKYIASIYQFDEKYIIPRTDYSTGIIDIDKNGIDDRDPYNSCGYTDLNYNCVADGAPCSYYILEVPEIPNTGTTLSPEEVQALFDSATPKYYTEADIGIDRCCEHGIVRHDWSFYCKTCVDRINALTRNFKLA